MSSCKAASPFWGLPPVISFCFSALFTVDIVSVLDVSHPISVGQYLVVLMCIFPKTSYSDPFLPSYAPLTSFGKCSAYFTFCSFLICTVWVSVVASVFCLTRSPISDLGFANIFSQSEVYLWHMGL